MPDVEILPLTSAHFTFAPWQWPFASECRAGIDAHFAARREKTPELWNGRVLLLREPQFAEGAMSGVFFETDFASFIAWKDWGCPEAGAVNCFSMGALRSTDGAYLLGQMGSHTANAGSIYFAAGTPEPEDISDGVVDLAANLMREVKEETGLTAADFDAAPGWTAVRAGPRVALMKLMQAHEPAEAVRARILRHLAAEAQPELADIRIVRRKSDCDARMPPFVAAYLAHVLGA